MKGAVSARSWSLQGVILVGLVSGSCARCRAEANVDAGPPLSVTLVGLGTSSDFLEQAGRLAGAVSSSEEPVVSVAVGSLGTDHEVAEWFSDERPEAEFIKGLGISAAPLSAAAARGGLRRVASLEAAGGARLVAANLKDANLSPNPLKRPSFVMTERAGVKVAIIGLADERVAALPGLRAAFLEPVPVEEAMFLALDGARSVASQLIVVVVDGCPLWALPAFEKHPEWNVNLILGGACEQALPERVGATLVYGLESGKRVVVHSEISKGQVYCRATMLGLAPRAVDDGLRRAWDHWEQRLDEDRRRSMGQVQRALAAHTPELRRWAGRALRDELHVDVSLVGEGLILEGLEAGALNRDSVARVMSDVQLATFSMTGAALRGLEDVVVGPATWEDARTYRVAAEASVALRLAPGSTELSGHTLRQVVAHWTSARQPNPLEGRLGLTEPAAH